MVRTLAAVEASAYSAIRQGRNPSPANHIP